MLEVYIPMAGVVTMVGGSNLMTSGVLRKFTCGFNNLSIAAWIPGSRATTIVTSKNAAKAREAP